MHVFPDVTLKERAAFAAARQLLRNMTGVKFSLLYPATFRIMFKDEENFFTDPELAVSYIKENILAHNQATS